MVFVCKQCGICCMYMGDYIVIDHMIGPFEYTCESVSTGTPFTARVDEDREEIFSDHTFPDQHPSACRFLRPDGNRRVCTIHRDSPPQCKFYRCVIMRIFNENGVNTGIVTGNFSLHSDDPGLRSTWEEACQKIPESNRDSESRVKIFLENHGYRVE
jgi:Fe-S-cluster containining protein